jgi:lipopolysaccharide/colanic/teichoic acid biosynthesis glycosyltransferase
MKTRKYRLFALFGDILLLAISYSIVFLPLPVSERKNIPLHGPVLLAMTILWITVSFVNGKLLRGKIVSVNSLFRKVLGSNFICIVLVAGILVTFKHSEYEEAIVLGSTLIATVFELMVGSFYIAYRRADIQTLEDFYPEPETETVNEAELLEHMNGNSYHDTDISGISREVVEAIENECGCDIGQAILKLAGDNLRGRTAVLSTTTIFNVAGLPGSNYDYIINLHRINDIKRLDNFLDTVNRKVSGKGRFLCCVETKDQRKSQFLKKYPPVINYILYTVDFFLHRVMPKFRPTRRLYIFLTRGENEVISRAEALGRLSRAGFRIEKEAIIENLLCIEVRRKSEPIPHNDNVYSTLIALPRIGRGGNIIKVYKLRTMHPYSEYIQEYVHSLYSLRDGGKFKNDFRITSWGGVCRKIWLDEIPMFINLLRGEMKLVGIRPLSRHYFDLYNDELKNRRIKYKPGLIPPFYADLPSNLDEIQASETRYLNAYDKHPLSTDLKYLIRSLGNILFHNVRSK